MAVNDSGTCAQHGMFVAIDGLCSQCRIEGTGFVAEAAKPAEGWAEAPVTRAEFMRLVERVAMLEAVMLSPSPLRQAPAFVLTLETEDDDG